MDLSKKICAWCKDEFRPNSGKQIFCSALCRVKSSRAQVAEAKSIQWKTPEHTKPVLPPFPLEGISIGQIRHYMKSFPDQVAIKNLCREILTDELNSKINYTSAPVVNPEANHTRRMIEPAKGTPAYFVRYGVFGDDRDKK